MPKKSSNPNGPNPYPHLVAKKCKKDKATKRRRKSIMRKAKEMQRTQWL